MKNLIIGFKLLFAFAFYPCLALSASLNQYQMDILLFEDLSYQNQTNHLNILPLWHHLQKEKSPLTIESLPHQQGLLEEEHHRLKNNKHYQIITHQSWIINLEQAQRVYLYPSPGDEINFRLDGYLEIKKNYLYEISARIEVSRPCKSEPCQLYLNSSKRIKADETTYLEQDGLGLLFKIHPLKNGITDNKADF